MTTPEDRELEALAAGEIDDDDARLLAAVADLYATADPVPSGLVDRLRFGITLDALHAEIAELERMGDLAGARSDDATLAQTVTFTSARLTILVTVTASSAERARIDGWITGGPGATVEIRSTEGSTTELADEDGRFAAADVRRGPVQFTVQPVEGTRVVTPSITI